MKPPRPDRGPFRSAAVWLVERLRNVPDLLDRATVLRAGTARAPVGMSRFPEVSQNDCE